MQNADLCCFCLIRERNFIRYDSGLNENLFKAGLLNRDRFDNAKLDYQEARWSLERVTAEIEVARKRLDEAQSELEKLVANQRKEWLEEINEVEEEIFALNETIENYKKKIARQFLYAPADGKH